MDFIRDLFALVQRLDHIVRDGRKRRDLPGMVVALIEELRGGSDEGDGEEDGDRSRPAVYQGRRAQADRGTPRAAARARTENSGARDVDLPEPAVYRRPGGGDPLEEIETARAPARNADSSDEKYPEPAVAPLTREEYDYQPATAEPHQVVEPEFEPASAPLPEPEPEYEPEPEPDPRAPAIEWDDDLDQPAAQPADGARPQEAQAKGEKDDWFDLDDWQESALKVAGVGAAAAATAAGAMAIKDRFFGEDDAEQDSESSALPLGKVAEPLVTTAKVAAPAVAAAAVHGADDEDGEEPGDEAERADRPARPGATAQQAQRPHSVEILPPEPGHSSGQIPSQTLANPGIRLYGTMDAKMYAEFSERLAEQSPGGPIVIALTTTEGDPEIARSMADDIRLLRDRGRREMVFLGKTAVYSAGVLFMAAFPVSNRYLTRATKLLITENKRAQPLELAGGSLRSVASQLEHARREIEREIEREEEDYRAICEGSNVSMQELREKAPHEWSITASEAKAMGLIAEVV